MPSDSAGRLDTGADDVQDLSPDVQAIYRRMQEAGASWRAAPELARLSERLRDQARQLTLQQAPQASHTAQPMPDFDLPLPPAAPENSSIGLTQATRGGFAMPNTQPHTRQSSRSLTGDHPQQRSSRDAVSRDAVSRDAYPHGPAGAPESGRWHTLKRRVGGALAATAALAIVGAVTALLLSAAQGHVGGSPAGQSGRWVSLDALAADVEFDANDLPAVAPSDPHVVYESLVYGIQQGKAGTLRRTDDGGATWHELSLPVPAAHVGHAGFLVSPLDAHTVFLTLIDTKGADCPAGTAQPNTEGGSGAVLCWIEYTSTDGGDHWSLTKLPAPGALTPNITNNSATSLPTALGPNGKARLYAILQCTGAASCSRLVGSSDGGITWQYADVSMISAGARTLCAATADARGTAIYAATTAGAACSWQAQQPLTLWRSDDAGAHWKQLGPLATPNMRGLQVAHPTGGNAILYAVEPRTTQMATDKMGGKYPIFSADATDVKMSSDGGATWTDAPSAGVPSGMKPYFDVGALGTLSDGSIVVEFVSASAEDNFSGGTLFAWKPGNAAWRQLAPPLSWEAGALTVIPSATGTSGGDTLYLVMVDRDGGSPAKEHPTYSFLRYEP